MAITKLFYIGTELASPPLFSRRFFVDDSGKRCFISLGTATANDWTEFQFRNKSATTFTTSQTLTVDDNAKILVFSGASLGITLPDSSTLQIGWRVTVVNENTFVSQVDSATAHTLSITDKPVGKRNILVSRSGSDKLNGISTELHGFSLVIPPKGCVDIWLTASGKFATGVSTTVGWRDNPVTPLANAGTRSPTDAQISSSFMRGLRFTRQGAGLEKEVFYTLHINHDYVLGTKVYPHVHWTPGDTVLTHIVGWAWEYCVVKGHGQQALTLTGTTVSAATTMIATAYTHYITEVSDTNAIPADNLEPDTLIYFRMYRDSANTNGTGDNFAFSAYVQFVDAHYLSTDGGTPLKAPPFYL